MKVKQNYKTFLWKIVEHFWSKYLVFSYESIKILSRKEKKERKKSVLRIVCASAISFRRKTGYILIFYISIKCFSKIINLNALKIDHNYNIN